MCIRDRDYGARVGLLPLDGTAQDVVWVEVEPCFVFHPMNAYDGPDGSVVLDVVRHPRMFASDLHGPNEGATRLERWQLDPASGSARTTTLDDRGQEFPRHDDRLIGKPYRYGYGAQVGAGFTISSLLRHDLQENRVEIHSEGPSRQFMEPVFVPRSSDAAEDDGWILSFVYDSETDGGEVIILHAQDFEAPPVARIELPQRVPFGFHGNWVPDRGIA